MCPRLTSDRRHRLPTQQHNSCLRALHIMLSGFLEQFYILFERTELHVVDYERALFPRLHDVNS